MTPKARTSNPETSHQAAASVKHLTQTKLFVLKALSKPRHDNEMVRIYRAYKTSPMASDQGIKSRRAELVAEGFVEDSGKRVVLPSGRKSIVWRKIV